MSNNIDTKYINAILSGDDVLSDLDYVFEAFGIDMSTDDTIVSIATTLSNRIKTIEHKKNAARFISQFAVSVLEFNLMQTDAPEEVIDAEIE